MPRAARSKAWVCGLSLAGIAGLNPAVGMDVLCLENVVCCQRSLRRADHSSTVVVPILVFLSVIWKPKLKRPRPSGGLSCHGIKIILK
jgi:hypothetical protein